MRAPASLLALALAACSGGGVLPSPATTLPGEPLRFEPIVLNDCGGHTTLWSGYETPLRLVIRDAVAWAEAWETLGGFPGPAPETDFDRDMVVVVAMGMQPSTGYGLQVVEAALGDDAIWIALVEHRQGSCPAGPAVTYPATAVSLPRSDLPLRIQTAVQDGDCR